MKEILIKLIALYQELLNKMIEAQIKSESDIIFNKASSLLGKEASPRDLVDDDVACAESLTTILSSLYEDTPIITGTYTLWDFLKGSPHYQSIWAPQRGCIILSPTGTGNGNILGHTGIIGEGGKVMSNNSYTGLWTDHLTLSRWNDRYGRVGGFPILFFKRK